MSMVLMVAVQQRQAKKESSSVAGRIRDLREMYSPMVSTRKNVPMNSWMFLFMCFCVGARPHP